VLFVVVLRHIKNSIFRQERQKEQVMRLRNIPGSREIIESSKYVVHDAQKRKGGWNCLFPKDQPLHIEVGMGKGRFIMDMARVHPEINYIGIEMYDSVLLRAIQKREEAEEELSNLYFLRMDARELPEIFSGGEVDRIYLNFSDPWPKDRHAKRRLTSRQFLERYEKILRAGGSIEFKTDNRSLFEFSLEEVKESGWKLLEHTFDLHHTPEMCRGNIMTEYEEKFSSMGNPIYKMVMAKEGVTG
jgi:tRNA (guanine-N7-)-methyltransferase